MSVDQSWTTAPSFFTMTAKYHDLQGFILERARNPSTPPKMVADREKNHNWYPICGHHISFMPWISCLIRQDSTDLGLRVCWVDQPLWTKGWPPFSRFWPRAERRRRSARETWICESLENLVSVVTGKMRRKVVRHKNSRILELPYN